MWPAAEIAELLARNAEPEAAIEILKWLLDRRAGGALTAARAAP